MSRFLSKFRGEPSSYPVTPRPKKIPKRAYDSTRNPNAEWDRLIDEFLKSEYNLLRLKSMGYSPTYLYHRLQKRIDTRKLRGVLALTLVNNVLYMERIK